MTGFGVWLGPGGGGSETSFQTSVGFRVFTCLGFSHLFRVFTLV
jgi:hypothetical protein